MAGASAWRRRPARPAARPEGRGLWISLALHLSVLLCALFLHRVPAPPPAAEPSFDVVFAPASPTRGVAQPGDHFAIPEGPTSNQPAPPRVNLLPPEYARRFAPPPPPPDEQAEARPPPSPAPARRQARNNPFAHVQQYSFAPAAGFSPPRGLRHSRSLDLSVRPEVRGGQIVDAVAHVISPGASSDYLAGISEYVETHKFYPPESAANGEQGTSVIEVTIARDGRVRDVRLRESAGSRWLDMAWLGLFRGHRFAPFPDDMKEAERTFTLSMDYELIYR